MTSLNTLFSTLRPLIDSSTHEALTRTLGAIPRTNQDAHEEMSSAAHSAVSGGKRFRGLLVFLGAHLVNNHQIDEEPVTDLAAAVELYQASALVHDDIIDRALTRRSQPSTHRQLTLIHQANQWNGESEHFGHAGAILVGDLLFSAAEEALARQCATTSPTSARLWAHYSSMHAEVAWGQFLDLRAEHMRLNPEDPDALSIDNAFDVILHKSARYSLVAPTLLGAIAAGASDSFCTSLTDVLTPWGLAFQLRDDELGVFGDPDITGKPSGDDLREGKRTVLLALTWTQAKAEERQTLIDVLANPSATDSQISEAQKIIARHGRTPHEEQIDVLVARGHAALESLPISSQGHEYLTELADIVTKRKK